MCHMIYCGKGVCHRLCPLEVEPLTLFQLFLQASKKIIGHIHTENEDPTSKTVATRLLTEAICYTTENVGAMNFDL